MVHHEKKFNQEIRIFSIMFCHIRHDKAPTIFKITKLHLSKMITVHYWCLLYNCYRYLDASECVWQNQLFISAPSVSLLLWSIYPEMMLVVLHQQSCRVLKSIQELQTSWYQNLLQAYKMALDAFYVLSFVLRIGHLNLLYHFHRKILPQRFLQKLVR